jgi:hypothetical protein
MKLARMKEVRIKVLRVKDEYGYVGEDKVSEGEG